MAYSDYGGYAFRNGKRAVERSDFTITPEGGYGTPGMWPGFAALLAGKKPEERQHYVHAALGDGPLFVGLYKQSTVMLFVVADGAVTQLRLEDFAAHVPAEGWWEAQDGTRYLDTDKFDGPVAFEIAGHRLEVCWAYEDNYYQYARLTQPDGVVWTGWSGYGVGAGLEDCGYGYSTDARTRELLRLFPSPSPAAEPDHE